MTQNPQRRFIQIRTFARMESSERRFDIMTEAKIINWHDSSDRKWLANHMHWAMMNFRPVQFVPIDPESSCTHLKGDSDVHESI